MARKSRAWATAEWVRSVHADGREYAAQLLLTSHATIRPQAYRERRYLATVHHVEHREWVESAPHGGRVGYGGQSLTPRPRKREVRPGRSYTVPRSHVVSQRVNREGFTASLGRFCAFGKTRVEALAALLAMVVA